MKLKYIKTKCSYNIVFIILNDWSIFYFFARDSIRPFIYFPFLSFYAKQYQQYVKYTKNTVISAFCIFHRSEWSRKISI